MELKDIAGTPINVDDYVIFRKPNYSGIMFGKIAKLTPKKVRIAFSTRYSSHATIIQDPHECFVITDKDLVARLILEKKIKV